MDMTYAGSEQYNARADPLPLYVLVVTLVPSTKTHVGTYSALGIHGTHIYVYIDK